MYVLDLGVASECARKSLAGSTCQRFQSFQYCGINHGLIIGVRQMYADAVGIRSGQVYVINSLFLLV